MLASGKEAHGDGWSRPSPSGHDGASLEAKKGRVESDTGHRGLPQESRIDGAGGSNVDEFSMEDLTRKNRWTTTSAAFLLRGMTPWRFQFLPGG